MLELKVKLCTPFFVFSIDIVALKGSNTCNELRQTIPQILFMFK